MSTHRTETNLHTLRPLPSLRRVAIICIDEQDCHSINRVRIRVRIQITQIHSQIHFDLRHNCWCAYQKWGSSPENKATRARFWSKAHSSGLEEVHSGAAGAQQSCVLEMPVDRPPLTLFGATHAVLAQSLLPLYCSELYEVRGVRPLQWDCVLAKRDKAGRWQWLLLVGLLPKKASSSQ